MSGLALAPSPLSTGSSIALVGCGAKGSHPWPLGVSASLASSFHWMVPSWAGPQSAKTFGQDAHLLQASSCSAKLGVLLALAGLQRMSGTALSLDACCSGCTCWELLP